MSAGRCEKIAPVPGPSHDNQVRYYIGDWEPVDLAEITRELESRGVAFTIEGEELWIGKEHERMVDMLVESVTEE
jgi:hypothetical protein